ncbi:hypothetical protein LSAT2_015389, partial [Lamellibrachia satsuma]
MCGIQKNYKCQTSICEERDTAARDASDENIRRERATDEDSFQSRGSAPRLLVEVKRGDLTQFTADVLVNTPAGKNEDLVKCGRLSDAFCEVGGPEMQQILEDQIYRCLKFASDLEADSIAFPTVGCGKLRYDPGTVAQCFKCAVDRHASDDSCHISKV